MGEGLSFIDCSAEKNGGSIYIELKQDSVLKFQSGISFSQSSPQNTPGEFLFIACDDGEIAQEWTQLASFDSMLEQNQTSWLEETKHSLKNSLIYFGYSPTTDKQDTICIGNNGADIETCGWEDLPCFTIEAALMKTPFSQFTLQTEEHTVTQK